MDGLDGPFKIATLQALLTFEVSISEREIYADMIFDVRAACTPLNVMSYPKMGQNVPHTFQQST